ncbi:MAG: M23 family metallopeptidase [Polyangiaceae bacterium]|nr:M23 family metallopeptidase [Polyangiaceae bacterium]
MRPAHARRVGPVRDVGWDGPPGEELGAYDELGLDREPGLETVAIPRRSEEIPQDLYEEPWEPPYLTPRSPRRGGALFGLHASTGTPTPGVSAARTPVPPHGRGAPSEGQRRRDEARARLGLVPHAAPFPLGPFARKRRSDGNAQAATGGAVTLPSGRARSAPAISPRMTAVFGGLFGLATVASIFALLIQIFPVKDRRAEADAAESRAAEEKAAAATAATPPASRKKVRTPLPGPWRLSALKGDPTVRIVSGTMKRRAFVDALSEAKVPKAQAFRVLKALDGIHKFDHCGNKDKFSVALKRATSEVVAFEYEVSPTEIYQARADAGGLLRGEQLDLKVKQEEVVVAFYVGKDAKRSFEASGFEPGLLDRLDDAFNGRTSTEAFQEGGVVRAIAIETTALGLFVRYDRLLAAEYRPPDPSQPPLRAYFLDTDGTRSYVDEKGRHPAAAGWRTPVPNAPVTSLWNPKRMHPVLHTVTPHQGVDYGAPTGTPVYAAFRGTVESVGPAGASGNLITIQHPGGITTGYAHLSRFAPDIKVGTKVGTRQLIGYVGTTGRSTGPHLHFSAKKDGQFFDPQTLRLDATKLLPVADRGTFLTVRGELDGRLDAIPLPEPIPEVEKPAPAADADSGGSDPADADEGDAEAADDGSKPDKSAKGGASDGKRPKKPASDDDADGGGDSLVGADLSREPE